MTKFISTLVLVILGLVAIGAVGPSIATVIRALAVLLLIGGLVIGALRIVWWRTRGW